MNFENIDCFFNFVQSDLQNWNKYGREDNGTNDDYKNQLIETTQFFYKINDCTKVITNFETQKQFPFWSISEILTEIFAMNPPLMNKYKPEVIEWAYKLRDDKTIEYTYGRRWSEWNQIGNTINLLSKRLDSKRAVIDIFTPYDTDNNRSDVPCFPGYTKIISPEGNITLDELYKKYTNGEKYPVFSMNENKEVELQNINKVFNNGKAKVYRIYLDDKSYFDATENHQIYIKKFINKKIEYVKTKVKDLTYNDRIVPFTLIRKKKCDLFIKKLDSNWSFENSHSIARENLIFNKKIIQKGNDVHHIDSNRYNNRIENLMITTHQKHASITQKEHNRMKNKKQQETHSDKLKKSGIMKKIKMYKRNLKIDKNVILRTGKKMYIEQGKFNKSMWLKEKQDYGLEYGYGSIKQIIKLFKSWEDFANIIRENHRIIRIQFLCETNVYDLEVEKNHNYFIQFNNIDEKKLSVGSHRTGLLVSNCTTMYMFKVRENKLNMSVFFRSHDLFNGVKYDVILSSFINQLICMGINANLKQHLVQPGSLGIYEDSLHLYPNKDIEKYNKFLIEKHEESMQIFNIMYQYDNVKEMYDDLWYVIKCEESSYYGNFEFAKEKISRIKNPAFRDFARVYYNKNLKFNNRTDIEYFETQIFKW